MATPTTNPESAYKPVNLKVRHEIRSLIDSAAKLQGKTRSDFMIDAARRAAEEALLDQTLVRVDEAMFEQLAAALDRPASGPGVDRLLNARAPWSR